MCRLIFFNFNIQDYTVTWLLVTSALAGTEQQTPSCKASLAWECSPREQVTQPNNAHLNWTSGTLPETQDVLLPRVN